MFVHRRAASKLIFPSLYDMFVGVAVRAGESYDQAARREAEEELGVSGIFQPLPLFRFLYRAPSHGGWWSAVYEARCSQPVQPPHGEVAWFAFLSLGELDRCLNEWAWAPDSREAYRRPRAAGRD